MSTVDVGIIMGSDSDLPVMKAAAEILKQFDISFEVTIVSAHRTPARMCNYAESSLKNGMKVIIAGAGGAAHLPGMVAALTPLPVVGVPINATDLNGMDALLSIAQMPKGVPVATVAINNAANAGLLAAKILATSDASLMNKVIDYAKEQESTVLKKVDKLSQNGWESY